MNNDEYNRDENNREYPINTSYDNDGYVYERRRSYKMPRRKNNVGRFAAFTLAVVLGFGSMGFGIGLGNGYYKNRGSAIAITTANEVSPVEAMMVYEATGVNYDDSSVISGGNMIANAIKMVENSVVSINTVTRVNAMTFFGNTSYSAESAGSGIILHEDDEKIYIVTNNHVIDNAESITVSTDDSNSVAATVLGRDKSSDIAVLEVNKNDAMSAEGFNYKVATFAADDHLEVGQGVIAIGNAAGEGKSATFGIISAKNKNIVVENGVTLSVIQTDAAINPGNSGGALADLNGQVIGINTAKLSSNNVEGIGYAIPASILKDIAWEIIDKGTVEKPYLGIAGFDLDERTIQAYNIPKLGVYVKEVSRNSGAYESGLVPGDIITGFNGTAVTSMKEILEQIENSKVNDTVVLSVLRNTGEVEIAVVIKNANAV